VSERRARESDRRLTTADDEFLRLSSSSFPHHHAREQRPQFLGALGLGRGGPGLLGVDPEGPVRGHFFGIEREKERKENRVRKKSVFFFPPGPFFFFFFTTSSSSSSYPPPAPFIPAAGLPERASAPAYAGAVGSCVGGKGT